MTALIGYIFQFVVLILGEYFSGRAQAREELKEFKIDQAKFEAMTSVCVSKMREQNRKESAEAQAVEDRIDQNKPTGGEP